VRVLGRVVMRRPGAAPDRLAGIRGWRSFTSVPVRDAAVVVESGGVRHEIRADRGGVIDQRLEIDLEPGWREVRVSTDDDAVEAPVFVVDPGEEFGIVSDVDDTVMVTALPRPLLAAWNTFVLDVHARTPVTGMAVLYDRLHRAHPGAPIVYLSTGAWNVAPTLTRFLGRNLYPAGPLLLTDWGPTHDRFFRSGRVHKEQNLERLASEFPHVKWLLFGDDGQHDEAIYSSFIAKHPGSVAAVAIRQLYGTEAMLAGGRSKAERHSEAGGVPWVYGPDGMSLYRQLRDLGFVGGHHDEGRRV
jgi:phosphatidate phosphatase APP1